MIDGLFNFKILDNLSINCTKNELYNQLLLYIFMVSKKNIILVTPTLTEANNVYMDLKNRIDNLYIFPDDDYLTKRAIATSPDLLYLRLKLLNKINSDSNINFIICHTTSFLKKLPSKNQFKNSSLKINKGFNLNRDDFIKKLNKLGYKRESVVTNTGEYALRGFVIDIFPIFEEHPIRIELFDDNIDSLKYFDENTQLTIEALERISINPLVEELDSNNCSILDYLDNSIVIYQDYEQILNVFKALLQQIEYYNDSNAYNSLNAFKNAFKININILNRKNDSDFDFISQSILDFNNDKNKFLDELNKDNCFLCTTNTEFFKFTSKEKLINVDISSGFVFNNKNFYSINDINHTSKKLKYENLKKIGKKVSNLNHLKIGDYVVHPDNGIGVYMGIKTIMKSGIAMDYILVQYKGNDKLYISVDKIDKLYKYSSVDGAKPVLNKLNSIEWQKKKISIKKKIRDISDELLKIYKERANITTMPCEKDTPEQLLFENEFEYDETFDQIKTSEEIKKDMESNKPMDRLLCGDVGYGKTEVVFRAIFKAVMNNMQVFYLCPTTLLSYQQYLSAIERFKNYGVNIGLLNRYTSPKELKLLLDNIKKGKVDIVFGTHRLLSDDVNPKNLGLLVIDEEQRFGVMHKEKIKKMKNNVHVLSVSATPIPRSLQMSLVGIRDLSLIETPPKMKLPISTYVINYDPYILRELLLKEKARNGQSFILYNKVIDIDKITHDISLLVPELSIKFAHGKMKKDEMQDIMYDFNLGKFDVLISTTIIENGIDIPNANTIIVMDSERFGLSQLYQIRGRVGRSDKQAYAYLMYDQNKILTDTAKKRLEAIKEFTELGSGYKIAMRDLSIRGAGDILGSEQAGFIDSVGIDMYLQLINEEINGSLESEEKSININDVTNHIDEKYTNEDEIIIDIHKNISKINDYESYQCYYNELKDRFGIVDLELEYYMKQELLEKIFMRLNIKILINDRRNFVFRLGKDVYSHLNIEKLFIESTKISTKFHFVYKLDNIEISISKNETNKEHINPIFRLIIYIDSVIKKDL